MTKIDGLSSYYSYTSQINALKNQKTGSSSENSSDPQETLLSIRQQEYDNTLALSDSADEDGDNGISDFFSYFLSLLKSRDQATTAAANNPTTTDAQLLYAIQTAQSKLNLSI